MQETKRGRGNHQAKGRPRLEGYTKILHNTPPDVMKILGEIEAASGECRTTVINNLLKWILLEMPFQGADLALMAQGKPPDKAPRDPFPQATQRMNLDPLLLTKAEDSILFALAARSPLSIRDAEKEVWDSVPEVNVYSVFAYTLVALSNLIKNGGIQQYQQMHSFTLTEQAKRQKSKLTGRQ